MNEESKRQVLPADASVIQLIAFPYAGAGSNCYRMLGRELPKFVQLVTHELPGHGSRIREPLLRRVSPLVEDAIERLGPSLKSTYAFYGHSFGGLLAREITRRLLALGRPLPKYLLVSGLRAPLLLGSGARMHHLSSPEFRIAIAEMGGIPEPVLADEALMQLFERLLRADLEALETQRPERAPPLNIPIHVMLGLDDHVTLEQAQNWQVETSYPLSLSYFPGGHFFIRDHAAALAKMIADKLRHVSGCSEVTPRG